MTHTKIYGHGTGSIQDFLNLPLIEHTSNPEVRSLEGGGFYFVIHPTIDTMRELLNEIPGITVFDSHHSPHKIKTDHHTLLSKHGVIQDDSMWVALEKMVAHLNMGGRWHPHV